MELRADYEIKPLMASCPNCQSSSLYSGNIFSKIVNPAKKEILFCKSCKFTVSVLEYKKLLFCV